MKPSPSPAAYPLPWRREANDTMARFLAADGTGIAIAEKASANDALWSFIVEALASRGTRALTEEELLTPELIKKAADAGERVGWEDVLTPNAQIYHRAIDLKKYETALRAVLPIIISRLTGEPSA